MRQVGYLQELYRDARSAKHTNSDNFLLLGLHFLLVTDCGPACSLSKADFVLSKIYKKRYEN